MGFDSNVEAGGLFAFCARFGKMHHQISEICCIVYGRMCRTDHRNVGTFQSLGKTNPLSTWVFSLRKETKRIRMISFKCYSSDLIKSFQS